MIGRALVSEPVGRGITLLRPEEIEVPIGPTTTAEEMRGELVARGTKLLIDTLDVGLGTPAEQVGTPVHAAKIDPAELRIDWSRPAIEAPIPRKRSRDNSLSFSPSLNLRRIP